MIDELTVSREEYDAAFERLEEQVQRHPHDKFARVIRNGVNGLPVPLTDVFYSLDPQNLRDVLTVMQCGQTYGWKRLPEDSNPQPGD